MGNSFLRNFGPALLLGELKREPRGDINSESVYLHPVQGSASTVRRSNGSENQFLETIETGGALVLEGFVQPSVKGTNFQT